jgi:hypothetical protein
LRLRCGVRWVLRKATEDAVGEIDEGVVASGTEAVKWFCTEFFTTVCTRITEICSLPSEHCTEFHTKDCTRITEVSVSSRNLLRTPYQLHPRHRSCSLLSKPAPNSAPSSPKSQSPPGTCSEPHISCTRVTEVAISFEACTEFCTFVTEICTKLQSPSKPAPKSAPSSPKSAPEVDSSKVLCSNSITS